MKRTGIWRRLDALMLLLFAVSGVVQYDDPDPVPWMLVYGAAALACALELAGRGGRVFPAVVAVAAAAWAVAIIPAALGHDVRLFDLVVDMEMHAGGVEEVREVIGLFIVAGWMASLAVRAYRR